MALKHTKSGKIALARKKLKPANRLQSKPAPVHPIAIVLALISAGVILMALAMLGVSLWR